MEEFWIISVPENGDIFKVINDSTNEISTNSKLVYPNFKFGNIDDLITFSEEAGKIIQSIELIISKLVQSITCLLDQRENLPHNLHVNSLCVGKYLQTFHWDYMKYPIRKKPQVIVNDISEQGTLIYEKMKMKVSDFNLLKTDVEKIEAKHTGSLLARDLSDFVKKEDILLGSKSLQTVLILVPSIDVENWRNYYEHFWHGIVPNSCKLLYKDNDFGLFTVVVTKDTVEGFKSWSLKSRIIVRKFEYNEDEIKHAKMCEYKKKMQLTANRRNLHFWLKKHYSLCFSMYIHIQILRLMSESVLKYGLNNIYTVILIKPKFKHMAKTRKILDTLFNSLEEDAYPQQIDPMEEQTYTYPNCGNKDYHPYVNCSVYSTGSPMKTKLHLVESLTKGTS